MRARAEALRPSTAADGNLSPSAFTSHSCHPILFPSAAVLRSRWAPLSGPRPSPAHHPEEFPMGRSAKTQVPSGRPGWGQKSRWGHHMHLAICLSTGTLKAVFFIFASLCAWYSGYLLAELIPDVHLSSAVYSIHSIGKKPILKGGYHGGVKARTCSPAAAVRLG